MPREAGRSDLLELPAVAMQRLLVGLAGAPVGAVIYVSASCLLRL